MPCRVARKTCIKRNVEHYCDGIEMKTPRYMNQSPSMFALQVRRVGNSSPPQIEALVDDEVHQVKGMSGHALIGRIVKHERPTVVRRNHLSWQEVFGRPCGLSAPGGAAEHDE